MDLARDLGHQVICDLEWWAVARGWAWYWVIHLYSFNLFNCWGARGQRAGDDWNMDGDATTGTKQKRAIASRELEARNMYLARDKHTWLVHVNWKREMACTGNPVISSVFSLTLSFTSLECAARPIYVSRSTILRPWIYVPLLVYTRHSLGVAATSHDRCRNGRSDLPALSRTSKVRTHQLNRSWLISNLDFIIVSSGCLGS